MDRGLFITFEGIDGCGKSTQFEMLKSYLESEKVEYIVVREPGGTVIGEKIREILLSKKNDKMTSMAELLLFEAARAQITEETIIPSLNKGITVLCDRFFDSTTAYQGYARGIGTKITDELNTLATGGLKPDITFFIDITVDEALRRRGIRGEGDDRMEALGTEFQRKVAEGYRQAAAADSRIKTIDGMRTPEEIFEDIKRIYGERR